MPSGQRYCCVCKNHGQKYIGDKKVSMHRFPANKRVRRVWIQRCRNARPNFVFKNYDQTRLCSVHFNDGNGPKPNHNLPTIFPTKSGEQKIYQISVSTPQEDTLIFSAYVGSGPAQHLPFTQKIYQELQAPQKIFEILATPKNTPILYH